MAVDSSSTPYAMGFSVPGSPLELNETSTATALIFESPGIYSPDPTTATNRMQSIRAFSSYQALVTSLSAHASSDLITALNASDVQQALASCLTEWATSHPFRVVRPASITSDSGSIQDAGIILGADGTAPTNTAVNVENADFRVLEVYEKLFPVNGNTPTVRRLPDLSGATAVGLLDAIFQQVGEPSTQTYDLDLSATGSYRAEFYFRGVGSVAGTTVAPADVAAKFPTVSSAEVETIFWYILAPILDSVGGFADQLKYGGEWTVLLAAIVQDPSVAFDLTLLEKAIADGNAAATLLDAAKLAKAVFLAAEPTLKTILIDYFESIGESALVAAIKATTALAVETATLTLNLTLSGIQLFEFGNELRSWHRLNMGAVNSDGSGGITVQ
jgi:hypothetical protein